MSERRVWMVSDGAFSDWEILAVFDNEDAAKEFAARYNAERPTAGAEVDQAWELYSTADEADEGREAILERLREQAKP